MDTNITYCLRYLNKYHSGAAQHRYFLLCSLLETVGDQISYIGMHIGKKRSLAQDIVKGVEDYINYLFSGDFRGMYLAMKSFKKKLGKKSYVDGLAYSLAETLYNDIGFVMEIKG
ncbi:TPA: hypothetical protein HA265_07290 [Candidatus Woesearchaeota archaeon]|nr:hypothetical protein [Candidatus Woesearchaeota archaeon]